MRIQVATLNVWALPEPFAPAVQARMAAIGDRLAELSADVVALQEVWTGAARDVLLEAAQRAGFQEHWYLDDAIGGSGLVVLSRLPILESHFERFALSGTLRQIDNGEFLSGKGFARLRIQGADGPFSVIDTHLHARYRRRATHEYASHRTGQIIQLAARVQQIEEPLVLMGDFNFVADCPEYRVLTGLTGARDAALEYGDPLDTVLYSNPYRPPKSGRSRDGKRVDYVFVRDGHDTALRPIEVERVFDEAVEIEGVSAALSNHAGIRAEIEAVPRIRSARHFLNEAVIDLASSLLTEGREEALRRRSDTRAMSGAGMACAALALAGGSSKPATRRRFLRRTLRGAALLAVTPGIAASVMSEWALPNELSAYDLAERHLDQIARRGSPDVDSIQS